MTAESSLTWLDREAVAGLLPTIPEQLDLVHETYVAAAAGRVELPAKPSLHPREGAFLNAMPAYLADRDVVAMKWVSAYPSNRDVGLPTISGLIIVSDPATGLPRLVLDAEEITTLRTAVASGVAIRHLAHPGWSRVAILGFGTQGRSHAEVVRVLNPEAQVVAWGPRLSGPVEGTVEGVEVAPDARTAVEGADVVITAGPMSEDPSPLVEADWLAPRCLVLPVDYDSLVAPSVSRAADLFVVDDVAQQQSFVDRGRFAGWATARGSLGEALTAEPSGDLRLVCSLGVGSIDAVVAGAVWERQQASGVGLRLR